MDEQTWSRIRGRAKSRQHFSPDECHALLQEYDATQSQLAQAREELERVRIFISEEADALEEKWFSADADRWREFSAVLTPTTPKEADRAED